MDTHEKVLQERDYYRSQLNELTGKIIHFEYRFAEMTNEIRQVQKGLELIANLQNNSRIENTDDLNEHFTDQIILNMRMDRALILKRVHDHPYLFSPDNLKGYSSEEAAIISSETIPIPAAFLEKRKSLLFNSQSEPDPFNNEVAAKLRTKYFILVPVVIQNEVNSFLFAGRNSETQPLAASRLLDHDIHTLEALSGVIAAISNQFEKFRLLDIERTRIAREMHDDIGSELTKIKMFSQLLNAGVNNNNDQKQKLQIISEAASKVLQNINEIIWTMNSKSDNLVDLAAYIRRYASDYLDTHDLNYRIDFPEQLPSVFISNNIRSNIFLTIKEALHNIVKHAAAKNVLVQLGFKNSALHVIILDDGKGMETDSGSGNGLHNMKYRIENCGGSFIIDTAKDRGTSIQFTINHLEE